MLKHIFLLVLVFIPAFINPAFAVEVKGLDQASVPVESRSNADKNTALKAAMAKVIVKNTGDASVLQNPVIAAQVKNPNGFLVQFGYEDKEGQLYLKGQFDERRIIQLLRQAQVPVWGKQRPLVLVWLSFQDENMQRNLLSDASEQELRKLFEQDATDQGVPLLFPVMDLDDMMQVSEADVRGNFPEAVSSASGRYQADYFALANIQQQADGMTTYRFDLYPMKEDSGIWRPLTESAMTVVSDAEAVNAMVSGLSQYFVSQYAVADSGFNEEVSVVFEGIDTMTKLKALEQYVGQLTVAKTAVIASIQGAKVVYRFTLFGSEKDLERQLNLEPRLEAVTLPLEPFAEIEGTGNNATPMEYRWQ